MTGITVIMVTTGTTGITVIMTGMTGITTAKPAAAPKAYVVARTRNLALALIMGS